MTDDDLEPDATPPSALGHTCTHSGVGNWTHYCQCPINHDHQAWERE